MYNLSGFEVGSNNNSDEVDVSFSVYDDQAADYVDHRVKSHRVTYGIEGKSYTVL